MAGEPNIAVLGAGSVGCLIGGAWQLAGFPVSFIGRPSIGAEIDQHGLTLSDYKGWRAHLSPGEVDYRSGPEGLAEADIILVTVKSGATAAAAAEIDRHAHDGALVISFQNGISNIDALQRGLGGRFEVARGMVGFNVAHLGGGQFHKGSAGELWSDRRDATRELPERTAKGPAPLKWSDDILALAWGKLLINLNNAVNALSGRTLLDELRHRGYRQVFAASIREAVELLDQAGIEYSKVGPLAPQVLARMVASPDWLFNNLFFKLWKVDAKARSSMADDLAAGRKTEVDYLNGELIALADRLNADAPVNRAIVELVHKAEAGAQPFAPVALRKAILGR